MAPPSAGGAERGAALRESMRKALEKKAAGKSATNGAQAVASGTASAVDANRQGSPAGALAPRSESHAGAPPTATVPVCVGGLNALDGIDELDGLDGVGLAGGARVAGTSAGGAGASRLSCLDTLDGLDGLDGLEALPPQPASASSAPARAARAPPAEAQNEDPWPELPLGATPLGVEDGKGRAGLLRRQGDFASAARMWAKTLHVARRCRPKLAAEAVAELEGRFAAALIDVDDWPGAEGASQRALAVLQGAAASEQVESQEAALLLALQARARARMELGHLEGARADLAAAQAQLQTCSAAGGGPEDEAVSAALELEERWRRLQQPSLGTPAPAPASNAHAAADPAASRNQEFFSSLEREWAEACAADGWDEVFGVSAPGRDRAGAPAAAAPSGQVASAGAGSESGTREGDIPASSDYFRIQELLKGRADRELRPDYERKAYEPRCRRDLSELRRVEAETQQAIEEERARRAAEPEPIRTRSDVVHLDSLSTDSDSDGGDEEATPEDVQKVLEAEQAFAAFSEFQRLANEKEDRLAKWRGKFG